MLILFIAAAFSIYHLSKVAVWADEIWSINRAMGDPTKILLDRDITWPPTYFLLLNGWARLTSAQEITLRYFGALCGLLTTAFLIDTGRRLTGKISAGWVAAIAFATSSYAVAFIVELRGYTVMLTALAFFMSSLVRWVEQPSTTPMMWRHSWMILVAAQITVFYAHFVASLVVLASGLYVLLRAPRLFLRWAIGIMLSIVVAAPLLPQLFDVTFRHSPFAAGMPEYLLRPFHTFYEAYSKHYDLVFLVILAVAFAGVLSLALHRGVIRPALAWLSGWGFFLPIMIYLFKERIPLFSSRYLTFTMLPVFLLVGIGVSAVPQRIRWGVIGALLIVAIFAPWQPNDHRPPPWNGALPIGDFLKEMRGRFRPGDTLLIDPAMGELADSLTLRYYQEIVFPGNPLPFKYTARALTRRVWYVTRNDAPVFQRIVEQNRLRIESFGPWYMNVNFWEAPPDLEGITYDPGLHFLGADVDRSLEVNSGDSIPVTLWWKTDQPLTDDYTVTLTLNQANGQIIWQQQGIPNSPPTPTRLSHWNIGWIYRDRQTIQVPYHLAPGKYRLLLTLTRVSDGVRLVPTLTHTRLPYLITPAHEVEIDDMDLYSAAVWR